MHTFTLTREYTIQAANLEEAKNIIRESENDIELLSSEKWTTNPDPTKLPDQIELGWCVEDVKTVADDLTNEQCRQVLQAVEHHADATLGVNWDTIKFWADRIRQDQ